MGCGRCRFFRGMFALQLTTASGDIDAATLAESDGIAGFAEDALEMHAGLMSAGTTGVTCGRVQRDQIDVNVDALQQLRELTSDFWGVVFSGDHRPLDENAFADLFIVVSAGIDQLVHLPFFSYRNECLALFIGGAVKTQCEIVRAAFIGHATDRRNESDRANGDPMLRETGATDIGDGGESFHHGIVIVQGLAHAHEHQIAQFLAVVALENALDVEHLCDDFTGAQVSGEAHLSRGTKHTTHGAADLRADTGSETAVVAHQHGFDGFAIAEFQQKLARHAIAAFRFRRHLGGIDEITRFVRVKIDFEPALQGAEEMAGHGSE